MSPRLVTVQVRRQQTVVWNPHHSQSGDALQSAVLHPPPCRSLGQDWVTSCFILPQEESRLVLYYLFSCGISSLAFRRCGFGRHRHNAARKIQGATLDRLVSQRRSVVLYLTLMELSFV